jgi:PAS domain S-box-containing protein
MSVERELRHAEAVLRESEARFRSAFDFAGIGMALVSPDGEFLRVNASLCTMLGRAALELLGTADEAITHADDREVQRAEACALLAGERDVVHYEKRYMHPRGEPLWVTVTLSLVRTDAGAPHYLLAQVQDVDQRKRLMTDLMAMNARYERYEAALTRLTMDQVAAAGDATDGLIEALHVISEVVAETLDVDRVGIWQLAADETAFVALDVYERAAGRHVSGGRLEKAEHPIVFDGALTDQQVVTWDERDLDSPFDSFIRRVLVPEGVRSYLRAMVRNNGRWSGVLSVSRRSTARPWAPDEQSFVVAVSNIVAARFAQATHRRVEQRIRESEKMAAIGQLAGGIAHDFNNLLAVIQGCSDLLLSQLPDELADERELTNAVREAGQRASLLTRQLLLFSRSVPSVARVVHPNDVITRLAAMLQRLLGEQVALSLELSQDLLAVRVDPSQLEQVVMNLVVNARDAMPGGGRISVVTRNASTEEVLAQAPPSLAGVARRRRFIQLVVRDTGSGIAPDVLPRIFEPFFTTKGAGKGTGLGLATVYAIAENAGGFVTVTSRLGEGSSFAIWMPGTLDVLAHAPGSDDAPVHETAGATVLLVEDEEAVRRIATRMLEQRGYHVLPAPSADEAIALLEHRHDEVDLVLTDVAMPGMGGGQLAERVRVRWPSIPVVFMSGYHEDALLHGAAESQQHILIHKPFSGDALHQFVAEHLRR